MLFCPFFTHFSLIFHTFFTHFSFIFTNFSLIYKILEYSFKLHRFYFLKIVYFPHFQYVCHLKENIHYSPFKMWYVACLVRGMTVDEALRQLSVCAKKGASFARDTILEAQEMAVKNHNVEFKSNLWVGK